MVEHNMQEKQEKRVIIKDLESDAVEGLLEFMYMDNVSNITPIAAKLLQKPMNRTFRNLRHFVKSPWHRS